jgi:hypothetical protein
VDFKCSTSIKRSSAVRIPVGFASSLKSITIVITLQKLEATFAGGLALEFSKELMRSPQWTDNLRNLLLTPTKEMLTFFQQLTSVSRTN